MKKKFFDFVNILLLMIWQAMVFRYGLFSFFFSICFSISFSITKTNLYVCVCVIYLKELNAKKNFKNQEQNLMSRTFFLSLQFFFLHKCADILLIERHHQHQLASQTSQRIVIIVRRCTKTEGKKNFFFSQNHHH